MTDNLTPLNIGNMYCKFCDFKCNKKSDWDRHINTNKHQRLTNTSNSIENNDIKYICKNCGNKYKHRQSLFNHKKSCNIQKIIENDKEESKIINLLEEQNSLLKEQISAITNQLNKLSNLFLQNQKI